MPDDQSVHAHRGDGQHGVAQRLALGHRGALGADVDHVGRQPLAGDLEGRAGPGGVLEEQVDDRAPAQCRQLLHRPALDQRPSPRRGRGCPAICIEVQVGGGQQVAHQLLPAGSRGIPGRRWSPRSTPSTSSSRTLTRSPDRVGMFLPTWSARIGQLTVAAVHQHRQPDRAGSTEIAQGVQCGAYRAAGVQHVVDQHHHAVVDLDRQYGAADGAGRMSAKVVAIHRDVQGADGNPAMPSTSKIALASRWASVTPRVGMPSRTRPSAPRLASRIWWAIRAQARAI